MSPDYPYEHFKGEAARYKSVFYDEGGEAIAAAFNDQREYRGYASSGRFGRGFG